MTSKNNLLITIFIFTLFIFPGTHVLAQTSYDAKDRIYEMEKCEKSESGHYHERTDGRDPCEKESKYKKDSNPSNQKRNVNKNSEKGISPSGNPSGTGY